MNKLCGAFFDRKQIDSAEIQIKGEFSGPMDRGFWGTIMISYKCCAPHIEVVKHLWAMSAYGEGVTSLRNRRSTEPMD